MTGEQAVIDQKAANVDTYKAVIFDMDGTLIASTEADYLAWKKLFAEHGIDLTFEKYFPLLGIKSADVVKNVLKLSGNEAQEALQKKMVYFEEVLETDGIATIPFAEQVIQDVKNYPVKLALATSSRSAKMKLVMDKVGLLNYFDIVVTGEEVENGKPAPDIFLLAAERLGVPASECVVFEDAVNGVQAAKAAGMKCIAISTTHEASHLTKADVVIDSFEAVTFRGICEQLLKKE